MHKLLKQSFLEVKQHIPTTHSYESLLSHCLNVATENKHNAYISVHTNYAKNKLNENLNKLENNSLFGIPFSVKDVYCTKGINTTNGSKILKNYIPPYTATIVSKLENAGAIMIGKTNMDEFAMGSGNIFSYFGETKNPLNVEYITGGSSGGSAASVAEGSCFFSLGTDTGGSVRLPASYCGIVGFKPSYGSCSRYGMISYGSSLDTVGIFTKKVKESAVVYNCISGKDDLDATTNIHTTRVDLSNLQNNLNKEKIKIGIPIEYFPDELGNEIIKVMEETMNFLKDQYNVEFEYISLPHTKYALSTYYIIATAEASSNLSKYDGIRYGYNHFKEENTEKNDSIDLLNYYISNRSNGFGQEVIRRIVSGTFTLSVDKYETYFKKAQQTRRLITNDFYEIFKKQNIHFILTPCTPTTAIKRNIFNELKPYEMFINDLFTVPISLAGLPAISVPINLENTNLENNLENDKTKQTIGLQLIALNENDCIMGGELLEKVKI
ncbi:hypothetical protein ABK040_009692 [Willaertia magna]